MPHRAPVELLRQQAMALLSQTLAHAEHVVQRIERPETLSRPSLPARASSTQPSSRKRRRSSPAANCATGGCFSAHLAMPRTPTQDLLPCLSGELRGHQLAGVKWLATLYSNNLSGVLADELQEDRQVQVIGLFAYLKEKGIGGPFLLVASPQLLQTWASELHRLLPQGLLLHQYSPGTQGSREMLSLLCSRAGEDPASPMMRVVLVSHDTFLSEAQLICRHHFRHVVLDSQQQAAATVEQSMELACTIAGRPTMLLLRGSHPAQGQAQPLHELWPLLHMVLPDSWKHVYAAVNKLVHSSQALGLCSAADALPCIVSQLQDIIDRFVLSRTSEEVDLRQQRRDTKVCLYDIFNVI